METKTFSITQVGGGYLIFEGDDPTPSVHTSLEDVYKAMQEYYDHPLQMAEYIDTEGNTRRAWVSFDILTGDIVEYDIHVKEKEIPEKPEINWVISVDEPTIPLPEGYYWRQGPTTGFCPNRWYKTPIEVA